MENPKKNAIVCNQGNKDHLKLSHDDDNIRVVDVTIACPFHPPTFFRKIHIVPFSHFLKRIVFNRLNILHDIDIY